MVTGKKVLTHLVILILLVISIVVLENRQRTAEEKSKGPLFENFVADKVFKVEFTHNDTVMVLQKVKGTWYINNQKTTDFDGYIADTLMVQKIFDKMPLLNKQILSGSTNAATKELKVTKEDGIHVTMFGPSNNLLHDFIIGKKAKIWSNSYLKKAGEKKIYSVGENIRFAFKCDLLEWRQKKMINVDKNDITFIHFNSVETGVMNIGQSPEKTWHLIGDTVRALHDTLMDPIFKEILSVSAANWVYKPVPDAKLGFINPSLTLGFELSDGKKIAIIVGNKEEDRPRYYVKSSESDELFFMFNAKVRFMIDSFSKAKQGLNTQEAQPVTDSTKTATE